MKNKKELKEAALEFFKESVYFILAILILMLLWNYLIPGLVESDSLKIKEINFLDSLVLYMICSALFKKKEKSDWQKKKDVENVVNAAGECIVVFLKEMKKEREKDNTGCDD